MYQALSLELIIMDLRRFQLWIVDDDHQLFPSFRAVFVISRPGTLLADALAAYVIGLGVYLGFVWRKNLGTDKNLGTEPTEATKRDSMNVFIVFMLSLGFCLVLYLLSLWMVERDREFRWEKCYLKRKEEAAQLAKGADPQADP